ncbi:hypothetical protein PCASD_10839 [Puccinia coronata f. sp. avenae]|uniref:DUF4219 domain-containing protein n=1 Tax=Puccinia coronata f. sp. avenae TaxID=200324 RepID=A0A2N5UU32_9BASI|nr:hypothetical protein PCASD_10839 [Puccinia coronata f. sp. avenae]
MAKTMHNKLIKVGGGTEFEWNCETMHIKCFCHKMALVVNAGLKELGLEAPPPPKIKKSFLGSFPYSNTMERIDEEEEEEEGEKAGNKGVPNSDSENNINSDDICWISNAYPSSNPLKRRAEEQCTKIANNKHPRETENNDVNDVMLKADDQRSQSSRQIRTQQLDMEAFSRKDAMDDKGLSSIPKLKGDNYSIWESKMRLFLDARQLLEVCIFEQWPPLRKDHDAKAACALFHLSAVVDDSIYNSIFKLTTNLTPHAVWTTLKKKYASKSIFSLCKVWRRWDTIHCNQGLISYVDRCMDCLGEFKTLGYDVTNNIFAA